MQVLKFGGTSVANAENIRKVKEIIQLKKGECGMKADCDIMVDQLRAIDNSRLVKKTGELSVSHIERLKNAISVIIDF